MLQCVGVKDVELDSGNDYIETCWRVASQKRDLLNGDHNDTHELQDEFERTGFCNWAMNYHDGISNSQKR